MKKDWKRIAALAAAGAMGVSALAGCSSREEKAEELEEAMTEALAELEEEQEEETEEVEEEEELTDEELLRSQLSEGEQILLDSSTIIEVAFDTEVPDLEVEIPEDAVIWIYVPAAGISCSATEGETSGGDTSAVWLDDGNETDMADPNCVIHGYGADEEDGLYGLLNYGDAELLEEDPYVYVYTDTVVREYRIFAAYPADTEDILVNHNCYNQEKLLEYIDEIFNQRSMSAVVNEDLEEYVESVHKLLTFQVNVADGEDWIVQAVLTGVRIRTDTDAGEE